MNERQKNILKKMLETNDCFTSNHISDTFNISLRTAQNDIKAIVNYCEEEHIEYTYNKKDGYRVVSQSKIVQNTENTDSNSIRLKYILRLLLFSKEPIKSEKIASSLFISNTTLLKEMIFVKQVLAKYNLTIKSKPYHGSIILGYEHDKRNCIINENLITFHDEVVIHHHKPYIDMDCLHTVSLIVSNVLITNKFNITDSDFQNFLMIAYLSTIRSIDSCYLENNFLNDFNFNETVHIAKKIIEKLSNQYHFKICDSEIRFLASVLHGKNSLITSEIIPSYIENDVSTILDQINSTLSIDFSYSIELRLSLSLHLIPLYERISADNQLTEIPITNIHNIFSYSFELALIASQYINKIKNTELSEAEISYLAIHFNVILEKDGNAKEKKNVLFICSSRRSDSLLIKSGIYNHFSNRISQIDVKNLYEIHSINPSEYDVIFSTTLNDKRVPKNAIKLNHFLTNTDYNTIEFALNHGSIFKMIEPLFSKSRFITNLKAENKEKVISELTKLSANIIESDVLYEAILQREQNGYTSYGNRIALPHPNYLLAKKSFCSVAILDKPILWSENNKVQIIILCCASKNSGKDLQMLFNFISLLFNNTEKVNHLIKHPDYDDFMHCLKSLQNNE